MLINIIIRKHFGFVVTLSKAKKKEKSIPPIAAEEAGEKICLNIPKGKAYCSICSG